jgi:hypothetical protein
MSQTQSIILQLNFEPGNADREVRKIESALVDLGFNLSRLNEGAVNTGLAIRHLGLDLNGAKGQLLGVQIASNLLSDAVRKLGSQWRDAFQTNLQLEAAQRVLNHSLNDGAAAFEWVKEKALKYGIEVKTLAHDYGLFMAAAKDSAVSTQDAEKIFESFTLTIGIRFDV